MWFTKLVYYLARAAAITIPKMWTKKQRPQQERAMAACMKLTGK
jgi:hypothetical protein